MNVFSGRTRDQPGQPGNQRKRRSQRSQRTRRLDKFSLNSPLMNFEPVRTAMTVSVNVGSFSTPTYIPVQVESSMP